VEGSNVVKRCSVAASTPTCCTDSDCATGRCLPTMENFPPNGNKWVLRCQ
jgi:hypothetical protein